MSEGGEAETARGSERVRRVGYEGDSRLTEAAAKPRVHLMHELQNLNWFNPQVEIENIEFKVEVTEGALPRTTFNNSTSLQASVATRRKHTTNRDRRYHNS